MNIKKILSSLMIGVFAFAIVAGVAFAGQPQSLSGGGQIVEDEYSISFGGNIKEANDLKGQFQVNFHDVSNPEVSGGRFHSTELTDVNWFAPDSDTCTGAMNVTMEGRFNGEDGWTLTFRAGDNDDSVRITLNDSDGAVYDTGEDFIPNSSCVGTARTELDNGNINININL